MFNKEFKTKCLINSVDFEADLSTMYAEIRRCMTLDFPEDFGHVIVDKPGKELTDINSEEYEFYQKSWKSRRGKSEIILIVLDLETVQLSPQRQIQQSQ